MITPRNHVMHRGGQLGTHRDCHRPKELELNPTAWASIDTLPATPVRPNDENRGIKGYAKQGCSRGCIGLPLIRFTAAVDASVGQASIEIRLGSFCWGVGRAPTLRSRAHLRLLFWNKKYFPHKRILQGLHRNWL